jgi:hypothetical protein
MIKYLMSDGRIIEKKYGKNTTNIILSFMGIKQILKISGLPRLRELLLHNNQITEITELDELTSLEELTLHNNQITEIKGLDRLTNLKYLSLNNNQITEIKGLDKLIRLKEVAISNNQITEIKGLDELTRLQAIFLHDNQIKEMKGLDKLTNLQELILENNQITEMKDFEELTNLRKLMLSKNQIKKIPFTIMNMRNLIFLDIDCNMNPIIQRFLNRNQIINNRTIYNDSQNVHDSQIAKSIKQSIYNIINDLKGIDINLIFKDIINDNTLNKTTKQQLLEYCQDKTIHSLLNITFEEALCSVWKIISEHKESNEIKKILNEELKDSICKCFTGRLSRLVNCLNGFDSRVSIKINDKEQILNIIIKIRNKYLDDISKQKEEIIKELLERGYDKNTIDEYIIYLE